MRRAVIITLLVLLWTSICSGFSVDQQNDQVLPTSYWNISNTPVGQEFRPSVDYFDAAELYVKCMGFTSYPTSFVLEVYEWDVYGTRLSVSDTVSVAADYVGPVLFRFPGSVPLLPNGTYVLVIHELEGESWGLGCTGNLYYWGTLIVWGEPQVWSDAWFREGCLVTPAAAVTWGNIKSLYVRGAE